MVGDILRAIRAKYPALAPERMRAELIRRLITVMVEDAIAESARRIAALATRKRRRHSRGERAGGRVLGRDAGGGRGDQGAASD